MLVVRLEYSNVRILIDLSAPTSTVPCVAPGYCELGVTLFLRGIRASRISTSTIKDHTIRRSPLPDRCRLSCSQGASLAFAGGVPRWPDLAVWLGRSDGGWLRCLPIRAGGAFLSHVVSCSSSLWLVGWCFCGVLLSPWPCTPVPVCLLLCWPQVLVWMAREGGVTMTALPSGVRSALVGGVPPPGLHAGRAWGGGHFPARQGGQAPSRSDLPRVSPRDPGTCIPPGQRL
jgi:hypothetical protein